MGKYTDADIDPVNTDAMRAGVWDLWLPDYSRRIQTLAELRLLHPELDDIGWTDWLRRSAELPFWAPAPRQLKDEAESYLAAR